MLSGEVARPDRSQLTNFMMCSFSRLVDAVLWLGRRDVAASRVIRLSDLLQTADRT